MAVRLKPTATRKGKIKMADNNNSNNGISLNEKTAVKLAVGKFVIIIGAIIMFTASAVMYGITMQNRVDWLEKNSVDKNEYERKNLEDKINLRLLSEKIDTINKKVNKLLETKGIDPETLD